MKGSSVGTRVAPARSLPMRVLRQLMRLCLLVMLCALALQLCFMARIALMRWVDPASSTFQRTQALRILAQHKRLPWSQEWVNLGEISPQLQRAVIASEDAPFTQHKGLDWDAIQKARQRNDQRSAAGKRLMGGSTITQQLSKNLFLSGERTVLRKSQEALIALQMELLLNKPRILEIYLNTVEWGEGVYGAQAASAHYFRIPAQQLNATQAAQLAVMLPAPRRFEKNPYSPYLMERAETIAARMPLVALPR